MPRRGRRVPDDRHFIHYIEQHVADSLDAAVTHAEVWAKSVPCRADAGDARYPDPAWFAREILADLKGTRYYVAQGEAHKAAWYALRLGELIVDARNRGHFNGPDTGRAPEPIGPRPEPPPVRSP